MIRMMQMIIIILMALCLLGVPAFAQTTPVCGPDKGLAWDANSEPDMKDYRVYAAPVDTQVYEVVATVVHDLSKAVTLPDGTKTIQGGMAKVADGLTEFYVTARDASDNESDPSNHLICNVQLPPNPPTGITVTIQLENPS